MTHDPDDWLPAFATHLIATLTAEHTALMTGRWIDAAALADDADRIARLAWYLIDGLKASEVRA